MIFFHCETTLTEGLCDFTAVFYFHLQLALLTAMPMNVLRQRTERFTRTTAALRENAIRHCPHRPRQSRDFALDQRRDAIVLDVNAPHPQAKTQSDPMRRSLGCRTIEQFTQLVITQLVFCFQIFVMTQVAPLIHDDSRFAFIQVDRHGTIRWANRSSLS